MHKTQEGQIHYECMEPTIFRKVFGDGATVRVLDFFLDNEEGEYSMADVTHEEGICYRTLRPIWADLVTIGFIVPTKKMGKAKLYKVNKKSVLRKTLWQLEEALIDIPETDQLKATEVLRKQSTRKMSRLV